MRGHRVPVANYHCIFVVKQTDAFEAIAAVDQCGQRQLDLTAVELVEHIQRAERPHIEHDRWRQLRHPAHQAGNDRAGRNIVGGDGEAARCLGGVELIGLQCTCSSCSAARAGLAMRSARGVGDIPSGVRTKSSSFSV